MTDGEDGLLGLGARTGLNWYILSRQAPYGAQSISALGISYLYVCGFARRRVCYVFFHYFLMRQE